MGEFGYLIVLEYRDELPRKIYEHHENECQGDFAPFYVCKRYKENHHEDDTARPEESRGEKDDV